MRLNCLIDKMIMFASFLWCIVILSTSSEIVYPSV